MGALLAIAIILAGVANAQVPSYARDIAPLFLARCGGCHSAQAIMGGLDLGSYEKLMKGGTRGPAILAGNRAGSRLYQMLTGKLPPLMPMDNTRLTEGQIDMVGRWIDAGAAGPSPGESAALKAASPEGTAPLIKPRAALKPQIFDIAWAPGGGLLAVAGHKEVRILDARTGRARFTLSGHAENVRALAISRDGRWLAAAGGLPGKSGEVRLWDLETREPAVTISGHDDCIYAVAISPDSKLVATSSYDKLIKLWDASNGKEVRTLKDHIDAVYALAFTPDGKRLISGAADRAVKVWDAATGARLYTMSEATDGINTIAIDPAGRMVAAGGLDKSVRIWSLGEKEGVLLHSFMAHEDAILRLAWSPDGKFLASSAADRTIKILEASGLREVRALPQSDWVFGIGFSPDGRYLSAGRFDGSISIYDSVRYEDSLAAQHASR